MSVSAKSRRLTPDEYLEIKEKAERKSEFYDGEMFLMAGASREHGTITDNLHGEIYLLLKGGRCRAHISDLRVKVSNTGLYTYPDLLIVCDPPEYAQGNRNTLINPRVLIEVLSPATEKYDRTTKFRFYKTMPSLMECLLVSQARSLVEQFARSPEDAWIQTDFAGLDAVLELKSVPIRIPFADIYCGVEFPGVGPPAYLRLPHADDHHPCLMIALQPDPPGVSILESRKRQRRPNSRHGSNRSYARFLPPSASFGRSRPWFT